MGEEFRRPEEGFAFSFSGMKVNSRPDRLLQGKYPIAINVRGYSDGTTQTRPGLAQLFSVTSLGAFITDMRAYTALATDNLPRILAYDSLGRVWLDNAVQVGVMTATIPEYGASMIPFRPNASPTPWMYIANGIDYQKFSAPSATNVVTAQKVGIAEPQIPPEAAPNLLGFSQFTLPAVSWVAGGGAGAITDLTRTTDTIGATFPDPVTVNRFILQVATGGAVQYQVGELGNIHFGGSSFFMPIEDVLPPVRGLTIVAIRYFSGTTGRCVIVPTQSATNASVPNFSGSSPEAGSIFSEDILSSLRRGSLIQLSGGPEIVMVLSVISGPNNTISFETTTTGTHAAGETITGLYAIAVSNTLGSLTGGAGTGHTFDSLALQSAIGGAGIATYTESNALVTAAFAAAFASNNDVVPQPDDYLHVSLWFNDITLVNEVKILIDVGDGSFTQNLYYYTIRPSDLALAFTNTQTQLAAAQIIEQRAIIDASAANADPNQVHATVTDSGAQTATGTSQWSEVSFPIRALTRIGNDQTLTLANANAVQILVNANAAVTFHFGGLYTAGGGQPDVGDIGAPYQYRVRPRSKVTGAVGNPSPATRYGVSPRRQPVLLSLPSASYDSQIDTWDIFRYGGTVTSWRFIGSTLSSNSTFSDNYDDSAAQAGDALDFDNFEPWPSVDVPNTGTASVVNGTVAVVFTTDTDILSYLPGTLVRLGGLNVYTLWARPVVVAGSPNNYLLQFVENAAAGTNIPYEIQEPLLANQHLPYMWGPDASGTVFACGDVFRPGTLYFAKNYAPDSAPDTYNLEMTPPSEPLLGGETIDGLSFVASSERWWALYPQPQDVRQRYSVVQQPFQRGLAAPFGHCEDGQAIYWWAKDGIWSSSKGSLTDDDLYSLFPHEGVAGVNSTYNGQTAFAPDYSRAGTFRLAYSNGFLYATYQDSGGIYRSLTLDVRKGAWCVDVYPKTVSAVYHVEQPEGALVTVAALYPMTIMATRDSAVPFHAVVCKQQANTNDNGTAITCVLATNEFNGGDDRAPKQWGDLFLDLSPAAAGTTDGSTGVEFQLMSLGAVVLGFTTPQFIPQTSARTRTPLSAGGVIVSDFMGVMLAWTDDFTIQGAPTQLFLWQPSFTIQPAKTIAWYTFGSSFGMKGYGHVREVVLAYVSTATITLTITSYDGQSPAVITLPSTGGAYKKTLFVLTANKGQLFNFQATCAATFQLFLADSEIRVGQWGRTGPYAISKNFGDKTVAEAVI